MDDSERLDHDIDTICMNLGEWEDKFNDLEKENAELKDKCEKAYYSGWRDREKAREDGWPAILTKPLTLTREKPTEPGWYWYKVDGFLSVYRIIIACGCTRVIIPKSTPLRCSLFDGEWSGPIPEPGEKEKCSNCVVFGTPLCGWTYGGFKVINDKCPSYERKAYPEEVPETAEPDKRHCCHNYLNKSFFMALSTVPGIKRFYYNFCPQCGMGLKHGPAFLKQFI